MNPNSRTPHDPLDDLLAAAVHGELTDAQRAELDALLQNDPATRAAYQEIQAMHDLLERNHREAQPDAAFEDRLISGVRRKTREDQAPCESAWESALFLLRGMGALLRGPSWKAYAGALAIVLILAGAVGNLDLKRRMISVMPQSFARRNVGERLDQDTLARTKASENNASAWDPSWVGRPRVADANEKSPDMTGGLRQVNEAWSEAKGPAGQPASPALPALADISTTAVVKSGEQEDLETARELPPTSFEKPILSIPSLTTSPPVFKTRPMASTVEVRYGQTTVTGHLMPSTPPPPQLGNIYGRLFTSKMSRKDELVVDNNSSAPPATVPFGNESPDLADARKQLKEMQILDSKMKKGIVKDSNVNDDETAKKGITLGGYVDTSRTYQFAGAGKYSSTGVGATAAAAKAAPADPSRKLVRDAQLDLEVKGYQTTVDAITALAKADGGYLDSSNSQRGGNGKLQGSVVVKVAPENLDGFLLKLRDLGSIKNQSVSTEDVTKDYYDTQARLDNSRRMETQLQQLLAHSNGKVADLLQVERELGRVRGDIEQMQGQLKLYDFQVQYATVTISVAEKDLNQAAAYLLRENDQFSLFTGNVEDAFAQAKTAAETFKAEVLSANLQHESDNTLSATLAFSVPPDQIDGFLSRVRGLGRVDNFTRQTQRVANDGGDPSEPSDQTRTEKDHVQVQLTIRADDESPRQTTQLAVLSNGDIDAQAQELKDDAAKSGATVTASNFERAPDGTETATLSFRLALAKVGGQMAALQKLGRVESLTVQRDDRPDQAAADAGAPAEIDLRLHNAPAVRFEDQPPRQQTQLAVASAGNVDAQAQQVKSDALAAGYAVTASTFERSPDGTEQAALTFRLPLTQSAGFTATLQKLGKVESLAVQRNDVTGPDSTDPNAPAEISLNLHSEPVFVAENRGFWPTVRNTFGGAIAAFLGSVETIGVIAAFLLPWAAVVIALAWGGRRVYIARRSRPN